MRRSVHATALLIVAVLVVVSFSGVPISSSQSETDSLVSGPYIDEIVFEVIYNQDQRVLALQSGVADIDYEYFDPVHKPTISANQDIEIFETLRNGYGHITINCAKYPLNISGFRRAFAFAYDKEQVLEDIMDGFSRNQDSLVPYCSQWCIEDDLPWHYYTDQVVTGNAILDDLGFTIDNETGYRNAPDGTPFQIQIEYSSSGGELAGGTSQIGVDALRNLHINSRTRAADFNEYIARLDNHGDYDMVFFAVQFMNDNIGWLGYDYWSEYANVSGENPTGFQNATYDSWRDQLLYGTTYEDVYEAAAEMQKILHYNVPRLVVYENTYMTEYRIDEFSGHVAFKARSIANQWTFRNINQITSQLGGSLRVCIGDPLGSFNPFPSDILGPYSWLRRADDIVMLDLIYSSLFDIGPDGSPYPDLAIQMLQETHDDNPAISENHLRFTIDIVQNATWSDGVPLTANDIAFTFGYMIENDVQQTPFNDAWLSSDIYAIFAPTPSRVVIEWASETYWHYDMVAYEYILPMHILTNETLMEGLDYLTWNPGLDESHPMVTSGPFLLTYIDDHDDPDVYEFTYNPDFYFAPERLSTETVTTSSIPTSNTPTSPVVTVHYDIPIVLIAISSSGTIIVGIIILVVMDRRKAI